MANEAKKEVSLQKNIADNVLARVGELQEVEQINLPKDYSVSNALKSAWLLLQDTEDKDHHKALEVCSKESIANCLFSMVIQGLSATKKQCYFVVYGNKLTCQPSYFGTIAMAKRVGAIKGEPVANIIYEGDTFLYEVNPETGLINILKHEQSLENIDNSKIKGAYCILNTPQGRKVTVMTMAQIRASWNQGATKGNSPAHRNFPDEMSKKTVIGRACKMAINSSDDAWIMNDQLNDDEVVRSQRNADILDGTTTIEDADYEDLTPKAQNKTEQPTASAKPESAAEVKSEPSKATDEPY